MSDYDELKARLRKADEYEPLGHDGWEAADAITTLQARVAEVEAARDMMGELWAKEKARAEAAEAALAEAQAMVAAAYEAAANIVAKNHDKRAIYKNDSREILALITADQRAALDRLIAEAENRGLERATALFDDLAKDERSGDYAEMGNLMRSEGRAKKHEARAAAIRNLKEPRA